MPTLDERTNESTEERNQRLEAKTLEMGITHTFAQYLEQMETYLLALEKRVQTLEAQNSGTPDPIVPITEASITEASITEASITEASIGIKPDKKE